MLLYFPTISRTNVWKSESLNFGFSSETISLKCKQYVTLSSIFKFYFLIFLAIFAVLPPNKMASENLNKLIFINFLMNCTVILFFRLFFGMHNTCVSREFLQYSSYLSVLAR